MQSSNHSIVRVVGCTNWSMTQPNTLLPQPRRPSQTRTQKHIGHLHRLWLQVSWAVWQRWLAVWDEEHIQASVQPMVLLHHACLHTKTAATAMIMLRQEHVQTSVKPMILLHPARLHTRSRRQRTPGGSRCEWLLRTLAQQHFQGPNIRLWCSVTNVKPVVHCCALGFSALLQTAAACCTQCKRFELLAAHQTHAQTPPPHTAILCK